MFTTLTFAIILFCLIFQSTCEDLSDLLAERNTCLYLARVQESSIKIPPQWTEQPNGNNLKEEEYNLQQKCNDGSPLVVKGTSVSEFYVNGEFEKPLPCQAITLCNNTNCLILQIDSTSHFYSIYGGCPDIRHELTFQTSVNPAIFENVNMFFLLELLARSNTAVEQVSEDPTSLLTSNIFRYTSEDCFNSMSTKSHLFLEGEGNLPEKCSQLTFCNNKRNRCFLAPLVSMKGAILVKRNDVASETDMASVSRIGHGCSTNVQPLQFNPLLTSDGFFRLFNLPLYKYCGRGGEDISKWEKPVDSMDDLCRGYRIDIYLNQSHEVAAETLIAGMWKLQHPLLPMFLTIIEATKYFQDYTGLNYTSEIIFEQAMDGVSTCTYCRRSAYDQLSPSNSAERIYGITLENKWWRLLYDYWEGFCPSDSPVNNGRTGTVAGNTVTQVATTVSSTTNPTAGISSPVESQDGAVDVVIAGRTPKPPFANNLCRVVISEVLPMTENAEGRRTASFIELQQICPDKTRMRIESLSLFHLLIFKVGDPSEVHMNHLLKRTDVLTMRTVPSRDRARPKQLGIFVLGSDPGTSTATFATVHQAITYDDVKGVPSDPSSTYAIVLLKYPNVATAQTGLTAFHMQRTSRVVPAPIGDNHRYIISQYVQDVYVYGQPCPLVECEEFSSYLKSSVEIVGGTYSPLPIPTPGVPPVMISSSRCVDNELPMQSDEFQESRATPLLPNICTKIGPDQLVFRFKGFALQSSAQKLIVNINQFFDQYHQNLHALQGTPIDMTAAVTSLTQPTVKKILKNWKDGNIATPGRHRPRKLKSCNVDEFEIDLIRRTIEGFYANNRAPMATTIYNQFMEGVRHEEDRRVSGGEPDFIRFVCTEKNFRRLLRRLGYTYGKIETRDAILMRPDIVNLRGKYLTELRKNRQSPQPKKVIWLDETWIDPFARTGKAWVLKRASSYRERRKYAFHRHKVGRGGRLIILSAGGEDGFIPGSILVYPVSKKKSTTDDYHDNVNSETFIKWFTELLDELDKTNDKYIIVMDNAPYHGKSDIPKSSSSKQEMWDWIVDNIPLKERQKYYKDIKKHRKPGLWDKIKSMKTGTDYYIIDQMAAARGHRVVRLAPYNCDLNPIEFVWSDVKYEVRLQNTEQTIQSVKAIAEKVMKEYPAEKWRKHIGHVKKLEDDYWTADGYFEDAYDSTYRLVINVNDDEDDEDDGTVEYEESDYRVVPIDPVVVASRVHDDINDLDIFDDDDEELL